MTAFLLAAALLAPPADPPPAPPVVLDEATREKLRTVALEAARAGDVKTLEAYFAAGQPVTAATPRGDTLLILAVYNGHAAAAGVILKQPKVNLAARNAMGFTALDGAAFKGSVPLAMVLVKAGADVNGRSATGKTPLMLAALTGRAEMVDYLLAAGADPAAADKDGATALSVAEGQGAKAVAAKLRAAAAGKK